MELKDICKLITLEDNSSTEYDEIFKNLVCAIKKEKVDVWHDLRKNPDDLPENLIRYEKIDEHEVGFKKYEILEEIADSTENYYLVLTQPDLKKAPFYVAGKIISDFTGCVSVVVDELFFNVIAWRKIIPFESEVE